MQRAEDQQSTGSQKEGLQESGPIAHGRTPQHPRQPVQRNEQSEDSTQGQDRVEVGHNELRVMQDQVQGSRRQHKPGEAATREAHQEGQEGPHGGRTTRSTRTRPSGQLAEHLHAGRDGHDGRGSTELGPRVHIQAHDHHVMRPHAEAHHADGRHALHHALPPEHVPQAP